MSIDDTPAADAPAADTDTREPGGFWASRTALVIPAILTGLGILLVVGILDMDVSGDGELFGPKAFPFIAAVSCFVVSALLVVSILRNPEVPEIITDADGRRYNALSSNWTATAITFGSFVLFALLLQPAGWIIAAAVVFWGIAIGLGSKAYARDLLVGLAMSSVVQLVFGGLLGLTLPAGVMGLF